jgi:hypothetical protein
LYYYINRKNTQSCYYSSCQHPFVYLIVGRIRLERVKH